jgi:hypothetical protein
VAWHALAPPGRLKDVAVDCGGLILGVGNEVRLLDFDTRAYGRIPDGQQLRALRQQGFMLLFVLVGTALTWMSFRDPADGAGAAVPAGDPARTAGNGELHPPAPIGAVRDTARRRHRHRGPLTDSARNATAGSSRSGRNLLVAVPSTHR